MILNRGLKLIEQIYDGSRYDDDIWEQDMYRIKDIVHCLDSNHWLSKQWLVDELSKIYNGKGEIWCAGAWYGLLPHLLRQSYHKNKIISLDIDRVTAIIGNELFPDSKINFKIKDAIDPKLYYDADVFVCTSVEHIEREDITNLIDELGCIGNKLFALQSNNFFDLHSHINCSESLDEFVEYTGLEILYKGELNLGDFTRYMVIGK